MNLLGFHSTWGAFSFPFIFLATDLTVRIFGAKEARRIIFYTMFPALIISYLVSVLFVDGVWQGGETLKHFNLFVFRIAFASFSAYVIGQLMDIVVFSRLRENFRWWVAPLASGVIGNAVDTATFFTIAFYKTTDPYLSEHLLEVAVVDYFFKMIVSILLFLPLYGAILRVLIRYLTARADYNGE